MSTKESTKDVKPIVVTKPAVAERIADLLKQREQLELVLSVTVRTLAEMHDVPEGWQFDPRTRTFLPPVEPSLEVSEQANVVSPASDSSDKPRVDSSEGGTPV